jgi:hypothetical protein
MITRALLLHRVDREDYWVSGLTLPLDAASAVTCTDALELYRQYLESVEVVDWLVEEFCLQDDVFNEEYNDHDFTFQSLSIDYRPTWIFVNGEGETYEFTLSCDTIHSSTGIITTP